MRGRKTWSLAAALLLLAAVCVVVVVVDAECPNGCSGNGACMSRDKCDCYKNYQGNDCADRTCLFGRAHVDTPKGDIDMDMDRVSPGWILDGSQQHPAKTYEYFNPDAVANEAHFYMECSNKGICDRASGLCQCFDGYEGNGCQRTTCPGKCNGHGTCESMRELAAKNGGTLFGLEGSAGAVKYNLWDANTTYGCRCDPGFFGPDCNKRSCKVGVDPLYVAAGKPRYETFIVHAYAAASADLATAWFRLRVFDYFGESYITKKITMVDEVDAAAKNKNAKAVADAIMGVPNLTFRTITCEPMGIGSELAAFMSTRATTFGTVVTCRFIGNPGKLRLPEIALPSSALVTSAYVVTTSVQGEDVDWFTSKSVYTAAITGSGATLTLVTTATALPTPSFLQGTLIKIGQHIVRVSDTTVVTGTGVAGAPYVLTLEYPLKHSIGTTAPIYTADPASLVTTAAVALPQAAALVVGSDKMTFGAVAPAIATGDLLFFENAFFYAQELSNDGLPTVLHTYVRLNKKFGGTADLGADGGATAPVYKVTLNAALKPYQYVSECSGRGMCGYDSGICTCFKGYTNDNCDRQNILAL